MKCGDCKHAIVPNEFYYKSLARTNIHCAFGRNGLQQHITSYLLPSQGPCQFDPPRFEPVAVDRYDGWMSYSSDEI